MDFFKGFIERTKDRDIKIIRAIEDGNFVFVHVYQDIDNGDAKWVTTDMFDTNPTLPNFCLDWEKVTDSRAIVLM